MEFQTGNVAVYAPLIVSKNETNTNHINNETVVIYDISDGVYLYEHYNKQQIKKGQALSLVSTDNSSVTFLNVVTPSGEGIAIGGGPLPTDGTRSMGVLGWYDATRNINPSIMIVSGKEPVLKKSTVGINTYSVKSERYVLDINGPVHITEEHFDFVLDSSFEILSSFFGNLRKGIAIGYPSNTSGPYNYNILRSNNGGQSWTPTLNIFTESTIVNSARVYGFIGYSYEQYSFVGANAGTFLYYSNNYGETWHKVNSYIGLTNIKITGIYVTPTTTLSGQNGIRVFIIFMDLNDLDRPNINFFDIPYSTIENSLIDIPIAENNIRNLSDHPYYYNSFKNFRAIDGYGDNVFALGKKKDSNLDGILITEKTLYTNSNSRISYFDVSLNDIAAASPHIVIAVGENTLKYTYDAGVNWNVDVNWMNAVVPTNSYVLNSVFVLNIDCAVAVGNNGIILYSKDRFQTWNYIPRDILNSIGNADMINTLNWSLVYMPSESEMVLTTTTINYNKDETKGTVTSGKSKQYYLYLPNLFNLINHPVLDICGNMRLSGYLLVDNTADSHRVGVGSVQTTGGVSVSGNTWIGGNLHVESEHVTIGKLAGSENQGDYSIAIGYYAGKTNQGGNVVAVGSLAGNTGQGGNAVAVGSGAGYRDQGGKTVAVGSFAGYTTQGIHSVAVGSSAGNTGQGGNAVAVGSFAGYTTQ